MAKKKYDCVGKEEVEGSKKTEMRNCQEEQKEECDGGQEDKEIDNRRR
jgi:hypothetical protein